MRITVMISIAMHCRVGGDQCDISNAIRRPQRQTTMQHRQQRVVNRKCENLGFENGRQCPKSGESNKGTFAPPHLRPCQVLQIPDPRVFGDSDPRPNVYEASLDQSGVTTPHHHQYSRLCSPFILKYISPNILLCRGHRMYPQCPTQLFLICLNCFSKYNR